MEYFLKYFHFPSHFQVLGSACVRMRLKALLVVSFLLVPLSSRGAEYLIDRDVDIENIQVTDSRLLAFGNLSVWMGVGMGLEYNDNINLDPDGGLSDIIVRPSVFTRLYYPLADTNVLNFVGTLGFSRYLQNPQFNTSYASISPDSIVRYTFKVRGNIEVEILERFVYDQDPTTSPLINRTVTFRRFENGLGLTTKMILENADLGIVANRNDIIVISSEFESLGRTSYRISPFYTYYFSPGFSLGVQYAASVTRFKEDIQNGSTGHSFSINNFIEFSKYLSWNGSIGFSKIKYNDSGTINDSTNVSTIIFNSSLTHQLTEHMSHSISLNYTPETGFGTNFFTSIEVDYLIKATINDWTNAKFELSYQKIDESGDTGASSDRYIALLDFDFRLLDRTTLSVQYRFSKKLSSKSIQNYTENRIRIDATYSF